MLSKIPVLPVTEPLVKTCKFNSAWDEHRTTSHLCQVFSLALKTTQPWRVTWTAEIQDTSGFSFQQRQLRNHPNKGAQLSQGKGHPIKPHLPARVPYQSFQDGSQRQVVTRGVQQQSSVREAGKVHDFCLIDVVLHTEDKRKT